MPSPENFQRTLDTLAEYTRDIGDWVEEESVPSLLGGTVRDQEYSLTGHQCRSGDSVYLIIVHPDLRFGSILYYFSILDNIGADLELETAEAIVDDEIDDEETIREVAAETLLDGVDREEMDMLRSYCYQFISGPTHDTEFGNNESGSFTYFGTSHDIYPYEDSFGISDFYQAVRAAVGAGRRGNRLVSRSVYIDIDEESPEETKLEINFNW